MFTDKKELVKPVNWALRVYQPLGVIQVSDASAKWTPEGYEIRFDGGSAMIGFAVLFVEGVRRRPPYIDGSRHPVYGLDGLLGY